MPPRKIESGIPPAAQFYVLNVRTTLLGMRMHGALMNLNFFAFFLNFLVFSGNLPLKTPVA